MPSKKSSPILASLITTVIVIIGIMITGFFAFSPLSYVQLNITIKAWCMFTNGLLWMLLVWMVHWIEIEGIKRIQLPHLREIRPAIDRVAKLFRLSVILLKVIVTVIGAVILVISILQLHFLGGGRIQMGATVSGFIVAMIVSLLLIFRELSSARK